jgi:hypothetical protein
MTAGEKKQKQFDQDMPRVLRKTIVQYSRPRLKPRQHFELSQRELKGGQENIIPMIRRLAQQDAHKSHIVDAISHEGLDLALYKYTKSRFHALMKHLQDNEWIEPPRSPNYLKYISDDFYEYLAEHPFTKKILVRRFPNNVIIYFRDPNAIVVVDYVIQNQDNPLIVTDQIKRYIISESVPIYNWSII